HKGYPTKLHKEKLLSLGLTEQHRRSFSPVKQML
ncbi:MAG: ribonuclease HII, partial [Gammaproteobacteria bacterium]